MTTIPALIRKSVVLVLPVLGCFACSSDGADGEDGSGGTKVQGALTGGTAPASGKVAIIWSVSSGSPDYAYKFGEGTSTGSRYVVTPGSDPPKEALNSYGIGIGVVALFAAGTELPDGVIDEDALPEPLGISQNHAVIFRATDAKDLEWSGAFPTGYSCGACVRVPDGETGFDSFEPVSCDAVQLDVGETGHACNWT